MVLTWWAFYWLCSDGHKIWWDCISASTLARSSGVSTPCASWSTLITCTNWQLQVQAEEDFWSSIQLSWNTKYLPLNVMETLHLYYLAEDEDTNSATYRWFAGTWSAHLEGGKINKSSWLDAREEHAGNMEGNSEDHILSFCIHFQALWAAQGLPVTVKVSVSCLHTLQETWHHSTATTTC